MNKNIVKKPVVKKPTMSRYAVPPNAKQILKTSSPRTKKIQKNQHHINVNVRVRPINCEVDKKEERPETNVVHINSSTGGISVAPVGNFDRDISPTFNFASSVVSGSNQEKAFQQLAATLLKQLDKGFSCTLMAYGQTGSGKTYTMFGPTGSLTISSLDHMYKNGGLPPLWGILPRALMTLLSSTGRNSQSVTLHASAIEVYQGLAYDLLNNKQPLTVGMKGANQRTGMGSGGGTLKKASVAGTHPGGCRCRKCVEIKEEERMLRHVRKCMRNNDIPNLFQAKGADPMKIKRLIAKVEKFDRMEKEGRKKKRKDDSGFATVGEKMWKLETPEDIMKLAREVEISRTAVGHALNARSSRSHCLVHVHVTERTSSNNNNNSGNGRIRKKTLLLVDLAGSERIAKSQVEGVAKAQAISINKSLTTLGRVIKALGHGESHVPYRDSTLTMLLRNSFSGKSRTSVVINVASEIQHMEETVCSLNFGDRLAIVKNQAKVEDEEEIDLEDKATLLKLLQKKKMELKLLEQEGQGAGFGFNANPGQIKSFKKTIGRLEQVNKLLHNATIKDKEGGRRGHGNGQIIKLQHEKKTLEENINNQKSAVDRLTGVKFFHDPSPKWTAKDREIREIEAQLQLM